jgi:hypothetical protein
MIYQRRNGVGAPYNAIIHARLSERVMTLSCHFSLPTISLTRDRCSRRRGDNAKKRTDTVDGTVRFFM